VLEHDDARLPVSHTLCMDILLLATAATAFPQFSLSFHVLLTAKVPKFWGAPLRGRCLSSGGGGRELFV
jgi:hypothetical protein